MTIPAKAVSIDEAMDPNEVLDWGISMAPVLEDGEAIDDSDWSIVLGVEGVAVGHEIIEGDPDWPDPALVNDDDGNTTIIRFWTRTDPAFLGNPAFQGEGVSVPIEATIWTTSTPRRKRQRTVLIKVVEQ